MYYDSYTVKGIPDMYWKNWGIPACNIKTAITGDINIRGFISNHGSETRGPWESTIQSRMDRKFLFSRSSRKAHLPNLQQFSCCQQSCKWKVPSWYSKTNWAAIPTQTTSRWADGHDEGCHVLTLTGSFSWTVCFVDDQ